MIGPLTYGPPPMCPEPPASPKTFRMRRGWKAERERIENRPSKGENLAAQLEAAETGEWFKSFNLGLEQLERVAASLKTEPNPDKEAAHAAE